MMNPYARKVAFSFIEMIIAIVILSILAAIAMPRLTHAVDGHQLESAIGRYLSDVRYARELAMTTSRPVRIRVPAGEEFYSIETYYSSPGTWKPVMQNSKNLQVDFSGSDYSLRVLNAVRNADQVLEFDGFGYTTSSFKLVLVSTDSAKVIKPDCSNGVLVFDIQDYTMPDIISEMSLSVSEVSEFLSRR